MDRTNSEGVCDGRLRPAIAGEVTGGAGVPERGGGLRGVFGMGRDMLAAQKSDIFWA